MTYYEAPTYYRPSDKPKLFLAGGITGCSDWQAEAVKQLERLSMGHELIIFNPRRANFPMDNPLAAEEQITWEFHHLRLATAIMFWFPAEEIQPIALYELGAWSVTKKPLAIGCDRDYIRRQDVLIQTELVRPHQLVLPTLEATIGQALVALAHHAPGANVNT